MSCILCIDIGTSRVKTALIDHLGNTVDLRSQRIKRSDSPDTQDAGEWLKTVLELLRSMDTSQAAAVSLTGNMHALLMVDKNGSALAPAELWCSTSAQQEAADLVKRYPEFELSYGNKPTAVFALPKILRCKNQQPELYRQCRFFLQPKDYIGSFLTGAIATDPSDASGVMPFDLDKRDWDFDFINNLQLEPSKFPPVIESLARRGKVTAQAAAASGLQAGLPVICGCGDLASAALGCGAYKNVLSLTLGTAGQLLASAPRGKWQAVAGKLFVFAHADKECDLYLGSVPGGGFSYEWESKMRNLTMDEFFAAAEKAPLSENLPVYLPYLLGRGAPYMDYIPSGAWSGLSAHHTLNDICRATVFAPLAALRQSADMLSKLTAAEYDSVVLQSLACRETAVRDTAAALFPMQKFMPENSEASLLGAAILGATALGIYPSIAEAVKNMVKTTPLANASAENTAAAQQLYQRYLAAAEKLQY